MIPILENQDNKFQYQKIKIMIPILENQGNDSITTEHQVN